MFAQLTDASDAQPFEYWSYFWVEWLKATNQLQQMTWQLYEAWYTTWLPARAIELPAEGEFFQLKSDERTYLMLPDDRYVPVIVLGRIIIQLPGRVLTHIVLGDGEVRSKHELDVEDIVR